MDLVDGKLQELYETTIFVEGLGLGGRQGQWDVSVAIESQLTSDMDFIVSGIYCIDISSIKL